MPDRQHPAPAMRPLTEPLPDAEVIVVGAGPAGSAIAALLAEAGHDVLLLDKARFPRHKPCSDYVNPAAVGLLEAWGLGEAGRDAGARSISRMLVHAPQGQPFAVDFARTSGQYAMGFSRFRLDELLVRRAVALGATLVEGAHVRDVIRDRDRVHGVEATIGGTREQLRARLVIGADSRHSLLARTIGTSGARRWPRRTGLVAHYRGVSGLTDHGELHVTSTGYAGLAPLEDGLTNVALVLPANTVRASDAPVERLFEDGLRAIPALAERLKGAERVGSIRGVGPMAHRVRRIAGDGYLLLGDAAGFLDPFTGDGISEALRSAQLAAPIVSAALSEREITTASLAPYVSIRRRTFATKRGVCWVVQGFIDRPSLLRYATDRLNRRDSLALTLSAVLGDLRPAGAALSPWFLARLLWP